MNHPSSIPPDFDSSNNQYKNGFEHSMKTDAAFHE